MLDGEYEVLERLTAADLVGRRYRGLYDYLVPEDAKVWLVLEAGFVDVEEGTGIVHTSAAYGVDDLRLCQENGVLVRHTVDLRGRFLPEVEKFAGMFVKDADVPIMVDLAERGLLYKKGTIRHTYPFCWRCDTPLLYYALDSWFIRTNPRRQELVENNRAINWVPEHIRDGRMGDWLENNVDWSLSRYRYWATPLPVWKCEGCGEMRCVGSAAELGLPPDADLHRPHIDEVTLECGKCGGTMRRVVDLIDVWFDSGSMPFAQYHYPFEEAGWEHQFPADFISEALDQTRGWFYSPDGHRRADDGAQLISQRDGQRHRARRRGQEDVEVGRQRGRADRHVGPLRRRRGALVLLHRGQYRQRLPRQRPGLLRRWCGASC